MYGKCFWNEPVLKRAHQDVMYYLIKETKKIRSSKEIWSFRRNKIVMCAPTFRGGSQNRERKVFAETGTIDFLELKENLEKIWRRVDSICKAASATCIAWNISW